MTDRLLRAFFATLLITLLWAPPAAAQGLVLPEIGSVSGVKGHAQTYGLSCESRSAADVAAFWGSSYGETDILNALPRSDDPEIGFVGDVDGAWGYVPPQAYGVHAQPIARALQGFGLDAEARQSMSWDEARTEIAAGRPLVVWLIGAVWSGTPQTYTTVQGRQVTVAAYEHTMILIGYDPDSVTLVNAGDGKTAEYALQDFLTSWAVLNNMAVVVRGQRDPSQPTATIPGPPTTSPPPEPTQTLPAPAATPQQPEQPTPTAALFSFVVEPGDTLASLAARFETSEEAIAQANGLPFPYVIYSGQVLLIPLAGNPSETAAPALTPNVPVPDRAVTPIPPQPFASQTYVVQGDDTLAKIARRFGLNWRTLANHNRLAYPYAVAPGEVLQIPAGVNQQE